MRVVAIVELNKEDNKETMYHKILIFQDNANKLNVLIDNAKTVQTI